jgi:hypothetical protein
MKLTSNPRNTLIIIGAVASLAVYQLDHQIHDAVLNHMRVTGGTPPVSPARLDNLQQLYPLLATPNKAPEAVDIRAAAAAPQSLDQLFGRIVKTTTKLEGKDKAPEVVDYFAALNQTKAKNIRLDGLSPGVGAIINGAFVHVGEPITSLQYPADADQKKMVVPRLTTVAPGGISIREPNGNRTIVVTFNQ